MHIVQIEDFFHPDAGYQINIISKYFVKFGHQVTIVTADIDKAPSHLTEFFGVENIKDKDKYYEKTYGVKIIRLPVLFFLNGNAVFKPGLMKFIKSLNPDVFYIHGNDTLKAWPFLLNLKRLNYPVILDSHMLLIASTNPLASYYRLLYRKIITPIIIKNNLTVIRTSDDPFVEESLGIPLTQCPLVSFGSDLTLFHPDIDQKKKFRVLHKISDDELIVLYAGKMDESKGGLFLAKSLQEKIESKQKLVYVIVGNPPKDSEIDAIFKSSENRILQFPTSTYINLASYFQVADLCIFPRQCSLTFYDAQACGLPVIAEDISVNRLRLSHENGLLFNPGDIYDFRNKIINYSKLTKNSQKRMHTNALNYIQKDFNYESISNDYLKLIISTVSK